MFFFRWRYHRVKEAALDVEVIVLSGDEGEAPGDESGTSGDEWEKQSEESSDNEEEKQSEESSGRMAKQKKAGDAASDAAMLESGATARANVEGPDAASDVALMLKDDAPCTPVQSTKKRNHESMAGDIPVIKSKQLMLLHKEGKISHIDEHALSGGILDGVEEETVGTDQLGQLQTPVKSGRHDAHNTNVLMKYLLRSGNEGVVRFDGEQQFCDGSGDSTRSAVACLLFEEPKRKKSTTQVSSSRAGSSAAQASSSKALPAKTKPPITLPATATAPTKAKAAGTKKLEDHRPDRFNKRYTCKCDLPSDMVYINGDKQAISSAFDGAAATTRKIGKATVVTFSLNPDAAHAAMTAVAGTVARLYETDKMPSKSFLVATHGLDFFVPVSGGVDEGCKAFHDAFHALYTDEHPDTFFKNGTSYLDRFRSRTRKQEMYPMEVYVPHSAVPVPILLLKTAHGAELEGHSTLHGRRLGVSVNTRLESGGSDGGWVYGPGRPRTRSEIDSGVSGEGTPGCNYYNQVQRSVATPGNKEAYDAAMIEVKAKRQGRDPSEFGQQRNSLTGERGQLTVSQGASNNRHSSLTEDQYADKVLRLMSEGEVTAEEIHTALTQPGSWHYRWRALIKDNELDLARLNDATEAQGAFSKRPENIRQKILERLPQTTLGEKAVVIVCPKTGVQWAGASSVFCSAQAAPKPLC